MIGSKIIRFKDVFIISILICLCSCENKLIAGRYLYVSKEQKCELLIDKGGNFIETIEYLATGQKIQTTGTWSQKNSGLIFNDFLYSVGNDKNSILNPPDEYSSVPATVNGDVIIFQEESEYWFRLLR